MSGDLRATLRAAAAVDVAGPDVDAIRARAGRLRLRRIATGATAVLAPLVVLAAVTLPDRLPFGPAEEPAAAVLDVPPEAGEVAPSFLDDGTPVFVVNLGGEIRVLDARSPHAMYGVVGALASWCETSGWFEEHPSGSRFTAEGFYAGGPAPTGLVPYEVEPLGDGRVRVGAPGEAPPRAATPPDAHPAGQSCEQKQRDDDHRLTPVPERSRAHYLGRLGQAPAPEEALRGAEGTVLVEGTVEIRDGEARLCEPVPITSDWWGHPVEPRCRPGDPAVPVPVETEDGIVGGWQGLVLAEVRDGRLVGVTLTAVTLFYGGAYAGVEELEGALRPFGDPPDHYGMSYPGAGEPPEPDVFFDDTDGQTWGLVLAEHARVVGRERLAGTAEPTEVPLDRLLDALTAGERVLARVTIDRPSGLVVAIEELPAG